MASPSGTGRKPPRSTNLALTCLVVKLLFCCISIFLLEFGMRGTLTGGYRANSSLQPPGFLQERYLFCVFPPIVYLGGTNVAHHTKLYGVSTQILALIILSAQHRPHYFSDTKIMMQFHHPQLFDIVK
jgi:hypothetical protein